MFEPELALEVEVDGVEEAEEGKLILERTALRVRRRWCFCVGMSFSSPGPATVEVAVRGKRCLVPPRGVGGALNAPRLSVSSCATSMEGPASGDERRGRDVCRGERVLYLLAISAARPGMVRPCSKDCTRGGGVGEGATSIEPRPCDDYGSRMGAKERK